MIQLVPLQECEEVTVTEEEELGMMMTDWSDRRISNHWFPIEIF